MEANLKCTTEERRLHVGMEMPTWNLGDDLERGRKRKRKKEEGRSRIVRLHLC